MKKATLINTLSDEDVFINVKMGKFKVVSYKKNSVVHFDGEKK